MMLRLKKYDVDVVYVPGPEMWLADTLSRAFLPKSTPTGSVEAELETINMTQHLPISVDRLQLIRSATKEDNTLQTLITAILQGWPKNKTDTTGNRSLLPVSGGAELPGWNCLQGRTSCYPSAALERNNATNTHLLFRCGKMP